MARADGPLSGRRIVVTRAADQAGPLVTKLKALGAEVVVLPLIAIAPPVDGGLALRAAIDHLHTYDWVVLTSPNAAARFIDSAGEVVWPKVAAIGSGTAEVLRAIGRRADLIPQRSIGEGLADAFPQAPTTGGRVLLPAAAAARDVVPDGLRAKGWTVDRVEAYRTVAAAPTRAALAAAAHADAIAFTSASTVHSYLAIDPPRSADAIVVTIGPATTSAALAGGLAVHTTADPHTIDGLIDALVLALA